MKFLIINGSIHGSQKNSGKMLETLNHYISLNSQYQTVQTEVIHLAECKDYKRIEKSVLDADAFIFITGTYWDSWGSPLQAFLEVATEWEGKSHFFAKPVAVIVGMHSVGGKSVLSRLLGVLNSFGAWVPPYCGIVFSMAAQESLASGSKYSEDLWQPKDLKVLLENLYQAVRLTAPAKKQMTSWQIDSDNYTDIWWKNPN